jgi:ribosomal protein S18 acetylase RimI-like enzyme
MIRIRELQQEEWRVWRTLRIAALKDAPDAFGDTVEQAQLRSDEEWRKSLTHPEERLLVAEIDSGLVGMARVRSDEDDPERAGLYSMWVAPDARRKGVGRALIDDAIRWAAQNGVFSLWLCVTQGNEPAKSLYRSFGFKETGASRSLRSGSDKQMEEMQVSLDATNRITSR